MLTWLAVYPAITLTIEALDRLGLLGGPVPVRTLLLTLILVPLLVYVLMPLLTRLFGGWLRR